MKTVFLCLIALFIVSCESPKTGISSNPNFIKGKLLYSDNKPIENAFVVAINELDSFKSTTKADGAFSVGVEGNKQYSLQASLSGHLIFKVADVSPNGEDATPLEFKTDFDSTYYADSVIIKDTVTVTDSLPNNEDEKQFKDSLILSLTDDNFSSKTITCNTLDLNDDMNDYSRGDEESIIIGHYSGNFYRPLFKVLDFEEYKNGGYTKAFLSFNFSDESSAMSDANYKAYKLLKDWKMTSVCANKASQSESWGVSGIGFDGIDAEATPFSEGVFYDSLSAGNAFEIELTELFEKWTSEEESNYGFVITIDEGKDLLGDGNMFYIEEEDSLVKPVLKFYK